MTSILIRLVLPVVVLGGLFYWFDFSSMIQKWRALNPYHVAAAAALFLPVLPLQAIRLAIIIRRSHPLTLAGATQVVWVGAFFGQVLPSTIAGDAFKVWYLSRYGMTLANIVRAVLTDRLFGVLSIAVILAAAVPWLATYAPDPLIPYFAALLAAAIASSLAILVFIDRLRVVDWLLFSRFDRLQPLRQQLSSMRRDLLDWRRGPALIVLGCGSQVLYIAAAWQLGRALGLPVTFAPLLFVLPIVMIASALPASVGGWGIREVILVGLSTSLGIPAADAFALSILVGSLAAVMAAPGLPIWMIARR